MKLEDCLEKLCLIKTCSIKVIMKVSKQNLLFLLENGTGLLQQSRKVLTATTSLSEAHNSLWIPNHTCPPPQSC